MLERQDLFIGPWEAYAGRRGTVHRRRPVWDAATREPLGFVSGRPPAAWRWLRWLVRPVWQVFETEDASLLMTVRGPWLWQGAWEVFDAEPKRVGAVCGTLLLDGGDECLGVLQRPHGPGVDRFLSLHGLELGSFRRHERGVWLTFTAALEGNPFARMIVLAATLAQDDGPAHRS